MLSSAVSFLMRGDHLRAPGRLEVDSAHAVSVELIEELFSAVGDSGSYPMHEENA